MLLIAREGCESKIVIDDGMHGLLKKAAINEVALAAALRDELEAVSEFEEGLRKGIYLEEAIFGALRQNTLYFFTLLARDDLRDMLEAEMTSGLHIHIVEHDKKYTVAITYPGSENVNHVGPMYNTLQ